MGAALFPLVRDESFTVDAGGLGFRLRVRLVGGRVVEASFSRAREQPDTSGLSPAALRARSLLLRHFERGDADLASVPVDLSAVPPFQRRVLEALHQTRPGDTVTYGDLAAMAGEPGAARAVGTAMRRNPIPIIVPCHRVVRAATGDPGGYSGLGGVATKKSLLRLERGQRTLSPHATP